jgi:peptide/nickel transport system substrate-binding protein
MTLRMPFNADLDQKILNAQTATDQNERKAIYSEIQKELVNWVPGLYLFSPNVIIFKRAEVKGLVINSAPPLNEYWSVYKEAK